MTARGDPAKGKGDVVCWGSRASMEHVGLDPPLRFKALPAISLIPHERVVGVGGMWGSVGPSILQGCVSVSP